MVNAVTDLNLTLFYPVDPFFESFDLFFEVLILCIRYCLDLALHHFKLVLNHGLLVLEFSKPIVLWWPPGAVFQKTMWFIEDGHLEFGTGKDNLLERNNTEV